MSPPRWPRMWCWRKPIPDHTVITPTDEPQPRASGEFASGIAFGATSQPDRAAPSGGQQNSFPAQIEIRAPVHASCGPAHCFLCSRARPVHGTTDCDYDRPADNAPGGLHWRGIRQRVRPAAPDLGPRRGGFRRSCWGRGARRFSGRPWRSGPRALRTPPPAPPRGAAHWPGRGFRLSRGRAITYKGATAYTTHWGFGLNPGSGSVAGIKIARRAGAGPGRVTGLQPH